MKHKIFVIATFVMLCVIATACSEENSLSGGSKGTGSIYGIVVNGETGEPIRTATVKLFEKGKENDNGDYEYLLVSSTVTFDDGHFEIKEVSTKDYKITISHAEYLDQNYIVNVKKDELSKVDISMLSGIANGKVFELEDIMILSYDIGEKHKGFDLYKRIEDLTAEGYADWRLPTESELTMMYKYKDALLIQDSKYWSSTYQDNYNPPRMSLIDMTDGEFENVDWNEMARIRLVRDNIDIERQYTFGNLMVQPDDLGFTTFIGANGMCKASGLWGYDDWRLPTLEEAYILYNHKDFLELKTSIDNTRVEYWTSEPYDADGKTWHLLLYMGNATTYYYHSSGPGFRYGLVRAVRDVK